MKKGFTLIELIIVIVIGGILGAIVVPKAMEIFKTRPTVESQGAPGEYSKYNGSGCFIDGVTPAKSTFSAPRISTPRVSTPKVTPKASVAAPKHTTAATAPKIAPAGARPIPKPLISTAPKAKVQESRSSYYSRYSYSTPSRWQHEIDSRPSYGFFNSPWLWFFIGTQVGGSSSQAAQVVHHHSDDPNMKQFMNDLKEKAKDDPELAKRLMEIEEEKKKIEDQPKNPEYIPENVPKEVAVTTEDEYKKYNGSSGCFIQTLLGD